MLRVEITPNLSAAQFLSPRTQRRLERLVSRMARRNRPLWAALQEAQADQAAYDDWLCQQHADLEEDIPW